MNIEVFGGDKLIDEGIVVDGGLFKAAFEKAFSEITQYVNVIFVDEDEIRKLNKEYRQKDSATDVLSFNIDEKDVLGEVYVCLGYLKAEGRLNLVEVLRMIVHGILHLKGFDHKGYFEYSENSMGDSIGIANKWSARVEDMFIEQEKRLQIVFNIMKI